MIEPTPESRIRTGAWLAIAIAVFGSLVLGVATGSTVGALVGVLAAGVFGYGSRQLAQGDNRSRANGSVALVVASLLGAVAVVLAPYLGGSGWVVAATTTAVTLVVHDAVVEDAAEGVRPVARVAWASIPALLLGGAVSLGLYTGTLFTAGVATVQGGRNVVQFSAFAALVTLQALALGVVVLVGLSVPALERWIPDGKREESLSTLREFGRRPTEVPYQVWVVFSIQAVALAVLPEAEWFASVLGTFSTFGEYLSTALTAGVLHLPLVVVCLLALAVLFARGVQVAVVSWTGRNPARFLAYASGGILAAVVGIAAAAITAVTWFGMAPAPDTTLSNVGMGAPLLGAVLVALIAVVAVLLPLQLLSASRALKSAQGYGMGAAVLFLAALGTAGLDATPVATFVGVAAALLVWDFGENATLLRKHLGPEVDTREAELTHATASMVVGVLAVVVGSVAIYFVGAPTLAGLDQGRAKLVASLAAIAVVAFAILIER